MVIDSPIILASSSPRRSEILKMLGYVNFRVVPPEGEEPALVGLAPEITVIETAKAKLHACMAYPDPEAVIIAADTIVYADGHILGKPCDGADAARMLSLLSGKKHSVYSGLSIFFRGRELSDYELTDVYFRSLNADEIQAYVDSGEPLDKAGAYAAQGAASSFIRRIEGDFFNVVGLPVYRLHMMLTEIGAK